MIVGVHMRVFRVCTPLTSGARVVMFAATLAVSAAPASAQTPLADASVTAVQGPTASTEPSFRPFARLFRDTAPDFRRLPSVETVAILMLGGLAAAAVHHADRPVSAAMSGAIGLEPWFGAGRHGGGTYVHLGGALATYTIGRASGSRKTAALGADLVRANLVAQALTHAIKVSTLRSRPDGSGFSFPSGHTSSSFAAATVLQRHLGWKAGLPAYAAAIYVGASRIQEKRHYLSDVAFGAALGIVAGRTVTLDVGGRRLSVSPAATAGGAGIGVSMK